MPSDANLFYIESLGGAGTDWIIRLINKHPAYVCFGGTQTHPPNDPRRPPEPGGQYLDGLQLMTDNCGWVKTFGAIHCGFGPMIQREVEIRGGRFMWVLRHPLKRIHSLFSLWYREMLRYPVARGRIYDSVRDNPALSSIDHILLALSARRDDLLRDFEARFLYICHDTFYFDTSFAKSAGADNCILFEKVIVDRDYLANRLSRLLRLDEAAAKEFVAQHGASLEAPLNQHADDKLTPQVIFDAWPEQLKIIFLHMWNIFGGDALARCYAEYGYDLRFLKDRLEGAEALESTALAVYRNTFAPDNVETQNRILAEHLRITQIDAAILRDRLAKAQGAEQPKLELEPPPVPEQAALEPRPEQVAPEHPPVLASDQGSTA